MTVPSSARTCLQVVRRTREQLGTELSSLNAQRNLFLFCHPALENISHILRFHVFPPTSFNSLNFLKIFP